MSKRNRNKPKSDEGLLKVLNFAKEATPLNMEVNNGWSDDKYVWWGDDNLYPNFLLSIYKNSSLHKGIVNKKISFIAGGGVVSKKSKKPLTYKVNASDDVAVFLNKIITDYIIFGYYGIEVVYNKMGKPMQLNHIPAHHIRPNRTKTRFWICEDWFENRNIIDYVRYGLLTDDNEKGFSKLFFKTNYVPLTNLVYPEQEYSGAINSIVSDIAADMFFENDISNGFTLATIISFFKGQTTKNERDKEAEKFERKFSGINGSKYVLDFNTPTGKKPEVTSIPSDDYSDKLLAILGAIEQKILSAHSVTSPLLFGIKTEGQLGGSSELETAFEIFDTIYCADIRNEIIAGLSGLFTECGFELFEFKKLQLFTKQLDETTRARVWTVNELREIDGKPPIENGHLTVEQFVALGQSQSENKPEVSTESPQRPEEPKTEKQRLTDADFDLISDIGEDLDPEQFEFEEVSESDAVKFQKFGALDTLRKWLGMPIKNQKRIGEGAAGKKIAVRYKYNWREGFSDDGRSRPFCTKLMQLNRYYTRSEIQQMSARLGYDVFKHCGGWYYDPVAQEAVSHCRHIWKAYRIIDKS